MSQAIRTIYKQGHKNREINESVKAVMATILENRRLAAQAACIPMIELDMQQVEVQPLPLAA